MTQDQYIRVIDWTKLSGKSRSAFLRKMQYNVGDFQNCLAAVAVLMTIAITLDHSADNNVRYNHCA